MTLSRFVSSLAVALVASAALVVAGCGGTDDVPADAVAIVDGTVITKIELDELLGRAKKSYAAQKREFPKAGTSEYTALQNQAVAYLVQRAEYDKEAEKLGVTVTPADLDKRVAEVMKEFFGGDQKKLEAQLKEQGYTDASFRDDITAQILSEKIFEQITTGVAVTDEDVQRYYEENKAQYTVAASRDVRHILIAEKGKDGAIDFAASKTLADDVVSRLKANEDFAKLAKELSQDPGSAANGGKLSIQKGQTVAPFEKSSFSLAVDEVSQPIRTEFGYHVIQALGPVKAASTTPLATAQAQISEQLLKEKKDQAVADWTKQLEKDYKDKLTYSAGYAPPSTEPQSNG